MPPLAPAKKSNLTIRFDGWEVYDTRPAMSDEEFEAFCLQNPHLRIEQDKHGNIIIMSPVSYDSGNQESVVSGYLFIWNLQTKLGKTFSSSTMFILPDGEKRMPDAAWVPVEKHMKLSRWERKKFAALTPDFAVEVRSPSDDTENLKDKMKDIWIANGVRLAWLIDVEKESSWIFRADGSCEEIRGLDKTLSGEDVLPGFAFDLSVLKE